MISRAAALAVAAVVVGSGGGIADMRDEPGATARLTVETPSLGRRSFVVDEAAIECRAHSNGAGDEAPPTVLDVHLSSGELHLRVLASPYEGDGVVPARGEGVCVGHAALCCAPAACSELTLVGPDVVGLGGGDDCWVELVYRNGWVLGELACTFFESGSRERGTTVEAAFRCPIDEG